MRIEYDPALVEYAVFHAARNDRRLEAEVHTVIDPLYDLDDSRDREKRFQDAYSAFFRRLRLDAVLVELLAEHPLIQQFVGRCVIGEVQGPKQQGAELFVKGDGCSVPDSARTLIIQVCAQSLLNPESLIPPMRRELLHVADMLDEDFGYDPKSLAGRTPQHNLIRDRYRVLWDLYVEGRLSREGHGDESIKRGLSRQFEKAFGSHLPCLYPPALERVFHAAVLTHDQLLNWSQAPQALLSECGEQASRCFSPCLNGV